MEHAIGNADRFTIVTPVTNLQVDYDLKQAQHSEDGKIEYTVEDGPIKKTDAIAIGDSIVAKIVDDIERKEGIHIDGFIAEEEMLGHFIGEFSDKHIFMR